MQTIRGALLLVGILIMLPAAGYGQEQSPNKATQDSGSEVKKNSPSVLEGITDVIQAQKEKYAYCLCSNDYGIINLNN